MKKISIITPCRNAARFIGETVESVIGQTALFSGRAELEYIVCDGNSSDGTPDIVRSYGNKSIKIVSEPDAGMYDALSKGLRLASGEIVAYLNAGDFYNKHAFDIVLDLFESKKISWLTGYRAVYSESSYLVGADLPYRFRKEFFDCGFYCWRLPMVQQESTFWSSSLNSLIDHDRLSQFKYAGDYYLWWLFSKQTELKIVKAFLGGWRVHQGQLSENSSEYVREMETLLRKPSARDQALSLVDKFLGYCPTKIKKRFNKDGLFTFDHEHQQWI